MKENKYVIWKFMLIMLLLHIQGFSDLSDVYNKLIVSQGYTKKSYIYSAFLLQRQAGK